MRDGRLSAASRALVLKSCGATIVNDGSTPKGSRIMLADSVIPTHRAFKNYLPTNADSTLFRSPLPRAYTANGSPMTSADSFVQPTNTPVSESAAVIEPTNPNVPETNKDTQPDCTLDATCTDIPPSTNINNTNETIQTFVDTTARASSSSSVPSPNNNSPSSNQTSPTPSTTTNPNNANTEGTTTTTTPSSTTTTTQPPSPTQPAWQVPYSHITCDWSMRTMDALFNASFVDFIKNEKNCDFNGRHIAHLVKDYKLDQVVQGLSWLVDGWSVEATARCLKAVFEDWLPELAGFAVARVGKGWSVRGGKMGLVVAFMMMGEGPGVAALFVRSLCVGWSGEMVSELVSCLDTVLEWEDEYFTKFTEMLLGELKEAVRVGEIHDMEPAVVISTLSTMYKATAAMTNHRILMADLRLAVAKSHYLTQFAHSISCPNCLARRECSFSSRALTPNPASVLAAMRNRVRPGACAGQPSFVVSPNGLLRAAEASVPVSENGGTETTTTPTMGSQQDFSYLLDRIPPSLREFFGGNGASETEFLMQGSDDDFLYNFDQDEDGDADDGETGTESVIPTRTNSVLSVPSAVTARYHGDEFSRGVSEVSFRSGGVGGGGSVIVPPSVFETHQTSIDEFRSASSMMSMALSSLDLTAGVSVNVEGAVEGVDGREREEEASVVDPRRVVFSRGVDR
ncbi:hypothetical protein HDU99_010129, partial [Rhizoclosmatium hyalinum]